MATNAPAVRIVLEQFSHMDWDWQNTFLVNVTGEGDPYPYFKGFTQPANVILSQAGELLRHPDYYYAVCEMAFLRKFGETHRELLREMIASTRMRVVGGGIVSPDNLLPNGECFYRNYLAGLAWMQSVSLPWTRCVWLPDDFGHDSQLPVTLAAMDALAVGFARCALAQEYQQSMTDDQPAPHAGIILKKPPDQGGGCDFWWTAADGSEVFAHWMPNAYSQGNKKGDSLYTSEDRVRTIESMFDANKVCSPAPFVHIPVSDDFQVPLGGGPPPISVEHSMLKAIADWNAGHPDTPATLTTFDQYVAWVREYARVNPNALRRRSFHGDPNNPDPTTFRSNPYWMGYYASRMNLKSGHQQATRMLLAAETLDAVLGVLGKPGPGEQQRLLAAWETLVPSTHHDYITGTAVNDVVEYEQMKDLETSMTMGAALMTSQLAELGAALRPPAPALVVFNPLGFAIPGGFVEITADQASLARPPAANTQKLPNGNALVYVSAPSAGYRTFTTNYPKPPAAPSVTRSADGTSYTLSNGLVEATIAAKANWALTNVTDAKSRKAVISSGNTLTFFTDHGDIYEFGYEARQCEFSPYTPAIAAGPASIVEQGPLRVTVQAALAVGALTYALRYSLAAGSPYLEMTLTGQAPSGRSVFTNFTFNNTIATVAHGTPTHWDYKTPATFGELAFNTVIEPTHDYIIPGSSAGPFGAIYHQAVPGWGMSGNTLIGAIFRNTPLQGCDGRGAVGSDDVDHVITYALRVPSGLATDPVAALVEARTYNTPLWATVARPGGGTAPPEFSLASVNAKAPVILTSAKRGTIDPSSLFLRVYQGSNTPLSMNVNTGFDASKAVVATALEQVPSSPGPQLTRSSRQVSFTAPTAVTTLKFPLAR